MRRVVRLSAQLLALSLVLAVVMNPGLAFARAGGGSSMGSRGSMTFSAPPSTNSSPFGAAPMQRSLTPQAPQNFGSPATPGNGGFGSGMRSPMMSGLLGGLIGAGIGGMLFGHGFFGGIGGIGSIFGLLIQLAIIYFVVRFLFRMFSNGGARQPMFAGLGNMARNAMPGGPMMGAGPRPVPMGGGSAVNNVAIAPADYQAFEQLLKNIQAAWTAQDLAALRAMATPEMVSYFSEQLSDQASRGVRNSVTDVHLDRGDLAQAWAETGREYATVAMQFSMIDVTNDATGRVVDGSPSERVSATEYWTFLRSPGGRWVLSAIQQAK
jgi:predicted lipid-binding transport protein (Tim44 family)